MAFAPGIVQGTPAWIEARRATIGSSDIAVIAGESPHKSAYTLAAEKLGLIPEVLDDETLELLAIGQLIQPVLLDIYDRRTGRHAKGAPSWRIHPQYPWATASLDGTAPVKRVVEAKWTHSKRWRSGEKVPGDVLIQVQWQLFVVGWDVADVVVLDHTNARVETIERDDKLIDDLAYMGQAFYTDLQRGVLPPIDGSESTKSSLSLRYPRDTAPWVEPTGELRELVSSLATARAEKKRAEDLERSIANGIRVALGEAGGINGLLAFAKNRDSERTNWPAVAGAYRELLADKVPADELEAIQSTHTDRVEGARVLRLLSARGEQAA